MLFYLKGGKDNRLGFNPAEEFAIAFKPPYHGSPSDVALW